MHLRRTCSWSEQVSVSHRLRVARLCVDFRALLIRQPASATTIMQTRSKATRLADMSNPSLLEPRPALEIPRPVFRISLPLFALLVPGFRLAHQSLDSLLDHRRKRNHLCNLLVAQNF